MDAETRIRSPSITVGNTTVTNIESRRSHAGASGTRNPPPVTIRQPIHKVVWGGLLNEQTRLRTDNYMDRPRRGFRGGHRIPPRSLWTNPVHVERRGDGNRGW